MKDCAYKIPGVCQHFRNEKCTLETPCNFQSVKPVLITRLDEIANKFKVKPDYQYHGENIYTFNQVQAGLGVILYGEIDEVFQKANIRHYAIKSHPAGETLRIEWED